MSIENNQIFTTQVDLYTIKKIANNKNYCFRYTNREELEKWLSRDIPFPINVYLEFRDDFMEERPVVLAFNINTYDHKEFRKVEIAEDADEIGRKFSDDVPEVSILSECYPKEIFYCFREPVIGREVTDD